MTNKRRQRRKRTWYYLSFGDEHGFKGGCYVEVLPNIPIPEFAQGKGPVPDDIARAIIQAHRLGINPGGEVAPMGPLSEEEMDKHVPAEQRNRLLTRKEIEDQK